MTAKITFITCFLATVLFAEAQLSLSVDLSVDFKPLVKPMITFITCFLVTVLCAEAQFELSLSVVFKYPLPKCGPGAADDQIEQLVNNVCDCCGCIDNPVCREAQRSLLVNSLTIPFDAEFCNDPWENLFNKTAGTSSYGTKCPNPNYSKVTKHTACQIGFGCCNGKPLADEKLQKVQNCASSKAFDVMCEACSSVSATDSLAKFHQFASQHSM